MAHLITTLGAKSAEESGMILPHEHLFVDLRPLAGQDSTHVTAQDVIALMAPELEKLNALGITALVECTPVGVGRRVDLVKAVSEAANLAVVVPTGIYREPWIPEWAHEASEERLRAWMLTELQQGVDDTDVLAGWIKLSAGDNGLTPCEAKILTAAAQAAARTGAVIGSHTRRGAVVLHQLEILDAAGCSPDRFIWIHAHHETDHALRLDIARRGAWIEFDAIGSEKFSDEFFITHISKMLDAGYERRVLLSHDRGWFDPAQPGGGTPKPFTYIHEIFLDKLCAAGVNDTQITELTQTNPFLAFAR